MIGSTNAGSAGNGGGAQAVAFIGVTYPEGSICTCSNGSITLIAENASGYWRFEVPSIGEWTVSAVKDTDESSDTIIVEDGGVYAIELTYGILWEEFDSLDLWGTGRLIHTSQSPACVSTTGATTLTGQGFLRAQIMNEGGWPTYSKYLLHPVRLKTWNNVIFLIDPHIQWNNYYCVWSRDIYGTGVTLVSEGLISSVSHTSAVPEGVLQKITIDVSNVTNDGLYFIGFYLQTGAAANTYVDIAKVYLEK